MENLKVGDMIIVVDNGFAPNSVRIGDIGVIVGGSATSDYEVRIYRTGETWFANKNRIIKYKNKIENQFTECARNLHDMYTAMIDAGFSEIQAWEMIMVSVKNSLKL